MSSQAQPPHDLTLRNPWDRKAVLSFDGGGIKGYASLLILRELMGIIARKEREHREPHSSSFAPWSNGPSSSPQAFNEPQAPGRAPTEPLITPQLPPEQIAESDGAQPRSRTSTIRRILTMGRGPEHPEQEMLPQTSTKGYLPCHYFDFIVGTSTGGLIAILLSRLRMDVDSCIEQYEELAGRVFAHPRFYIKGIGREKYNERPLEEAIRAVVARHSPDGSDNNKFLNFPSPEDLCKTFVVAVERSLQSRSVYLFRTYDHLDGATPDNLVGPRNPEEAHQERIWKIGRATSAAPNYLKKLKLHRRKFIDGGFGYNNPSWEAYREVRHKYGPVPTRVSILVSIGTGEKRPSRGSQLPVLGKLLNLISQLADMVTDPNPAHELVHEHMSQNGQQYFRWTPQESVGSLSIDEWRDQLKRHDGLSTRNFIRREIAAYIAHSDRQAELNDCAEHLINLRRRRAQNESRWRRYTLCTTILCKRCRRRFNDRTDCAGHLERCREDNAHVELDEGNEFEEMHPEFPGGPR